MENGNEAETKARNLETQVETSRNSGNRKQEETGVKIDVQFFCLTALSILLRAWIGRDCGTSSTKSSKQASLGLKRINKNLLSRLLMKPEKLTRKPMLRWNRANLGVRKFSVQE